MLELTVLPPLLVLREARGLVIECVGQAEGTAGAIVLVLPLETELLLLGALAALPDIASKDSDSQSPDDSCPGRC